jgi:hypothetical protein
VAVGNAMHRTGVVKDAAYEHLRLAITAPIQVCRCNGDGYEPCAYLGKPNVRSGDGSTPRHPYASCRFLLGEGIPGGGSVGIGVPVRREYSPEMARSTASSRTWRRTASTRSPRTAIA